MTVVLGPGWPGVLLHEATDSIKGHRPQHPSRLPRLNVVNKQASLRGLGWVFEL